MARLTKQPPAQPVSFGTPQPSLAPPSTNGGQTMLVATQEIRAITVRAQSLLKISSPEVKKEAEEDLIKWRRLLQEATEKRDRELEAPAKQVKQIRERAALLIKPLETACAMVASALNAYQIRQINETKARQVVVNQRTEEKTQLVLQHAAETGQPVIALPVPKVIEGPAKTSKIVDEATGEAAAITYASRKDWRIRDVSPTEDVKKLPASDPRLLTIDRQWLVLNTTKITKAIENGIEIPGIEGFESVETRVKT